MSVFDLPACPEDCTGSMPDPLFSECAPETHFGEIEWIYISRSDSDCFTNVEDGAEWAVRLLFDLSNKNAIRALHVIGEKPVAETTEVPISGDRIAYGFKQHTLPFEIDETNEDNYAMLRFFECNTKHKIWYVTADGILYGGECGIEANVPMNELIPKERDAIVKYMGVIKWKSKFHPDRCVSPIV